MNRYDHAPAVDQEPSQWADASSLAEAGERWEDIDEALRGATELSTEAVDRAAPERVKILGPARLRLSVGAFADEVDAVLLNLAASGAACASPLELSPGETVVLSFRLDLGEPPLRVPSLVIWSRDLKSGFVAGLRFHELSDRDQERITAHVRARTEGTQAAWPLPTLQGLDLGDVNPSAAPRRGEHSVLGSSTWGFALGVVVASVAWLVSPPGRSAFDATDHRLPGSAVEADVAPSVDSPEPTAPSPVPVESSAATAELPMDTVGVPAAVLAPPSELSLPAAPDLESSTDVSAPTPPNPTDSKTTGSQPTQEGASAGTSASNGLSLPVVAAAGTPHFETFWLLNPARLVVDLYGAKPTPTEFTSGNDIEHPIVRSIRIGSHPTHERVVFELRQNHRLKESIEIIDDALQVRF